MTGMIQISHFSCECGEITQFSMLSTLSLVHLRGYWEFDLESNPYLVMQEISEYHNFSWQDIEWIVVFRAIFLLLKHSAVGRQFNTINHIVIFTFNGQTNHKAMTARSILAGDSRWLDESINSIGLQCPGGGISLFSQKASVKELQQLL